MGKAWFAMLIYKLFSSILLWKAVYYASWNPRVGSSDVLFYWHLLGSSSSHFYTTSWVLSEIGVDYSSVENFFLDRSCFHSPYFKNVNIGWCPKCFFMKKKTVCSSERVLVCISLLCPLHLGSQKNRYLGGAGGCKGKGTHMKVIFPAPQKPPTRASSIHWRRTLKYNPLL